MQLEKKIQDMLLKTLKEFWGYSAFRELQEEIIDSILLGNDTIALLPTGGGKSMCYQLPALITEGVCIVVSPLLALMKDQVEQLKSIGIGAEYLSSELNVVEEDEIYTSCREGITKLLYISPERLTNQKFLMEIQTIPLSFMAVDEAHCISEWGQDFRPSYKNIKVFREQFFNIPCIALTATATPKVLQEIIEKLNLKKPNIYQKGFKRDNINIQILEISDKYQKIYNYLNLNRTSGLIYTNTRKEAEELTHFLQSKGLTYVDYYHAGLTRKQKHNKQEKWQNSNYHILISTNAFGMGIDKDNVRFVIHFNPPHSIENYYQEIGRAGRDGADSDAYLLWNPQDLTKVDDILKNQCPSKTEYKKVVSSLYSMLQIAEHDFFPEKEFEFKVQKLSTFTKISAPKIKTILEFLHLQEIVYFKRKNTASSVELFIPFNDIEYLPKSDAYFIELLLRNITGLATHKVHFNEEMVLKKLQMDKHLFQERIKEMMQKGYLDYLDGNNASVRFLVPRDEKQWLSKYYPIFHTIQINKIRKWEEMKYFIQEESFCKMKMILRYFGDKNAQNCKNCSSCNGTNVLKNECKERKQILDVLAERACTLDEICILTKNYDKENMQEILISLLEEGKIRMKDFRTYMLA